MGLAGAGITAPRVVEIHPAPDPLAALAAISAWPGAILLESAGPVTAQSCFTYLMAEPSAVLRMEPGLHALDALASMAARAFTPAVPDLPPFQGGLAGYISYETGAALEGVAPAMASGDSPGPGIWIGRYDWVVAWDRRSGGCWLIDHRGDHEATAGIADLLREAQLPAVLRGTISPKPDAGLPPSSFSRPGYLGAVERVREYIRAGDVFQVNLSQQFTLPSTRPPLELYARLRQASPAPFTAYLDAGDHQILSASPELFLDLADGHVVTRPIKGTRPRGTTPETDATLEQELRASTKDRAENVMIVDLLRNDLSRVSQPGSVLVPELCGIEVHPTVHHLVSTVTARLTPESNAFNLLAATLPGGSITGAPKVRAMQIIRELEPVPRGVYCGAIGYITRSGDLRMSVAIRTMTRQDGLLRIPAGGGIVLDSEPAAEYDETLAKARAMLAAATE